MEMCYDGALIMPSSYAVMDEDEMTYVEGGRVNVIRNMPISAGYTYLTSMQAQCRAGAVAMIATGCVSTALSIVPIIMGGVATVTVSTLWSWADTYANAKEMLISLKSRRVKTVNIKEKTSGFHLGVTVSKAS